MTEVEASRRRILDAADADRRALERTLHDGLQQDLVALSANLQLLATHVDGSPEAGELLADLKQAAADAQRHAAELAQALYPPLLEARGLALAVRAAAGQAGVVAHIDVADLGGVSGDALNALYWVCVEALSALPPGSDVSIVVASVGRGVAFRVVASAPFDEGRLQPLRDRVATLEGTVAVGGGGDGRLEVYGTLPLPA